VAKYTRFCHTTANKYSWPTELANRRRRRHQFLSSSRVRCTKAVTSPRTHRLMTSWLSRLKVKKWASLTNAFYSFLVVALWTALWPFVLTPCWHCYIRTLFLADWHNLLLNAEAFSDRNIPLPALKNAWKASILVGRLLLGMSIVPYCDPCIIIDPILYLLWL